METSLKGYRVEGYMDLFLRAIMFSSSWMTVWSRTYAQLCVLYAWSLPLLSYASLMPVFVVGTKDVKNQKVLKIIWDIPYLLFAVNGRCFELRKQLESWIGNSKLFAILLWSLTFFLPTTSLMSLICGDYTFARTYASLVRAASGVMSLPGITPASMSALPVSYSPLTAPWLHWNIIYMAA